MTRLALVVTTGVALTACARQTHLTPEATNRYQVAVACAQRTATNAGFGLAAASASAPDGFDGARLIRLHAANENVPLSEERLHVKITGADDDAHPITVKANVVGEGLDHAYAESYATPEGRGTARAITESCTAEARRVAPASVTGS